MHYSLSRCLRMGVIADFILFKEWVPCTPERYALSIVLLAIASASVALLKAFRYRALAPVVCAHRLECRCQ
jgi:hypothetical protein